MVPSVYPQSSFTFTHAHKELAGNSKSSLFSRISVNWEKIIFFANTALLLAGVAYFYFAKYPFMAFALAIYSAVYTTLLHTLAQRTRPISKDQEHLQKELDLAQETLQNEREKHKKLEEKVKNQTELDTKIASRKGDFQRVEIQLKEMRLERQKLENAIKIMRDELRRNGR